MKEKITFDKSTTVGLFIFSLILVLFTLNHPFYWDTVVQVSIPANWYYETNFKFFYLPDNIATGHPTFIGMYFALLWKIFGRSLEICHIGMLPFVFGLLLQIKNLLVNLKINGKISLSLILVFVIADTTFLSQLSMITFDVIQLFFLFLCLNLLLTRRNRFFTFAYVNLMLISLRASIIAGGIVIFNVLYDHYCLNEKLKIRNYLKFVPGILGLLIFLLLFKINKGWIIHNTVSKEWESSGQMASFIQMIHNAMGIAWQMIDFGRVGIFIILLILIIKSIFSLKFGNRTVQILFFIIISQFLVILPVVVTSRIPFGHRYFLPVIIPSIILAVYWFINLSGFPRLWLAVAFTLLISGHFWLYPFRIPQGWDATTIHWNYFYVSEQMHNYVSDSKLDKTEIGTYFPNRRSRYLTHIEKDKNDVYGGEPFESKYVIYSNAFNVQEEVLDKLFTENSEWTLVKKFTRNRIYMSLYTKVNH